MKKRLFRSKNQVLGGVCGGLGEYFDVDPTFIRIGVLLATVLGWGFPALLYVILWCVVPEE